MTTEHLPRTDRAGTLEVAAAVGSGLTPASVLRAMPDVNTAMRADRHARLMDFWPVLAAWHRPPFRDHSNARGTR